MFKEFVRSRTVRTAATMAAAVLLSACSASAGPSEAFDSRPPGTERQQQESSSVIPDGAIGLTDLPAQSEAVHEDLINGDSITIDLEVNGQHRQLSVRVVDERGINLEDWDLKLTLDAGRFYDSDGEWVSNDPVIDEENKTRRPCIGEKDGEIFGVYTYWTAPELAEKLVLTIEVENVDISEEEFIREIHTALEFGADYLAYFQGEGATVSGEEITIAGFGSSAYLENYGCRFDGETFAGEGIPTPPTPQKPQGNPLVA